MDMVRVSCSTTITDLIVTRAVSAPAELLFVFYKISTYVNDQCSLRRPIKKYPNTGIMYFIG